MTQTGTYTRADVLKWADAHKVWISEDTSRRGTTHVHADIHAQHTMFGAYGTHNLGLWDGQARPDWNAIMLELLGADLCPCTIADCEYCAE